MKKKLSRYALKKWLVSTTGIVLTSVAFVQDINTIKINITNPKVLAQMIENPKLEFPKGHYLVEYKLSNNIADDAVPVRRKTIWAMSIEANTRKGIKLGDFSRLYEELEGYQYCVKSLDTNPAYKILGLLIEQPDSPLELASLLEILKKLAIFSSIEDGSGFMHLGNSVIGKIPLPR
ncbi:hypothetical protein ACQKC1_11880 [Shewanella baltica]|uniref:hypothetical protein n=1 Tax=Shewanella TaxID=22 RepID=UPI0021D93637|nr:hypothetical protein [Shewanella sp. SM55]MCU8060039.1 hypothetical protein [Shewanella sp. SM55]